MDNFTQDFNHERSEAGEAFGLAIRDVGGEPRILDLDLASRLGFAEPRAIRKLIKRHLPSLDRLGVRATVSRTPNAKGGAPTEEHYLNRKQAIFVTGKSETPTATEITIEIIERFDAYERAAVAVSDQIVVSLPDTARIWIDLVREARILRGREAGATMWLRSPLPPLPDEDGGVRTGTRELGGFVDECTEQAIGESVSAAALYEAYLAWCRRRGQRAGTATWFGRHLPLDKVRGHVVRYLDVRLREVAEVL
jgi:hypothetical protein